MSDDNDGPVAQRPTLVMLLGPAAVGKMTVGQELAKLTGFKLLYNHMVVDLVTEFVEFGTPGFHRLARSFTIQIVDEMAAASEGLILTHGIFFSPGYERLLDEWSAPFLTRGGSVVYAELAAPIDVRIARNETPNRRAHKKLDWATPERLREIETWGPSNSGDTFPYPDRHMLIDNSEVPAAEAARMIRERFGL